MAILKQAEARLPLFTLWLYSFDAENAVVTIINAKAHSCADWTTV